MNAKRIAGNALGIFSLACLVYCLFAYFYIQPRLTPAMPEPLERIRTLGNLAFLSLLVAGIYHIILLVRAFRTLEGRDRRLFPHSLFIVAVVLSGVLILSDYTLLSDIGKEYPYWDVYEQWLMLYGFTVFHIAVTAWGLLVGWVRRVAVTAAHPGPGSDAFFLAMNQIGVLCGGLGIAACVASLWGIVPDRFRAGWLVTLAILAVFPLAVFLFYIVVRNRKKTIGTWFDEKQMADTAAAALFSVFAMMLVLVPVSIVEASFRTGLPAPFWPMTAFFVGLVVLSAVTLSRSRTGAEEG
jgi:hypothetical protein